VMLLLVFRKKQQAPANMNWLAVLVLLSAAGKSKYFQRDHSAITPGRCHVCFVY
jgi:hypothetical protein